jgi:transposase InsO family protein
MHLREEFVLRALEPGANMAELSREYGISRKTAYKWRDRFKERGVAGLKDLSRRPHGSPLRVSGEVVLEVLRLRRERPRWGPKKLHAVLARTLSADELPSLRSIARILDRAGEIAPRKRPQIGRDGDERAEPLVPVDGPNDLWTVDFKGWWNTRDRSRCEPLTVRDAFSRFVLCVHLVEGTATEHVRPAFERLFEQHGLPKAIRVDNGSPFACTRARGGLTTLSAWWVSLGIQLVRGRPGHPEDNGGHERMHVEMRYELEDHAAPTLAEQQGACDQWRHDFNHVRPHEALGQRVPADVYVRSTRPYRGARAMRYAPGLEVRKVNSRGYVKIDGTMTLAGLGLRGHQVALRRIGERRAQLFFYEMDLGEIEWPPAASA